MRSFRGKKASRLFKTLFIFLFILLPVVFAALLIDHSVQKAFLQTKDQILNGLETRYNIKIRYSEISPSFLSSFQIKNLSIESTDIANPWRFESDRVRILINPLAVFDSRFRDQPDSFIRKVIARKGRVDVQLIPGEGDKDLSLSVLLHQLRFPGFDVALRNFEVNLHSDSFRSHLNINRFNIVSEEASVRLNWRIHGEILIHAEKSPVRELFFFNRSRGTASRDGSYFDIDSHFTELSTERLLFDPLKFNAAYRGGELSIRKIADNQPFDLLLTYQTSDDLFLADFKSENWTPGSLFRFKPGMDPGIGDFLDSPVTCQADIRSDIGFIHPEYHYEGDVKIVHPLVRGKAHLTTRFNGDEELIHFEEIILKSDWGTALYQGVFSLRELAPKGRLELKNMKTPFDYKINTVLDLSYDDHSILVDSIIFTAGQIKVNDVKLMILREKKDISGPLVIQITEGEELWADISKVSREGLFYGWDFALSADGIRGDHIARLLSFNEGFSRQLEPAFVDLSIQGILTPGGGISARFRDCSVYNGGDNSRRLVLNGDITNHNFNLDSLVLEWDGERIEGRANGIVDDKGFRMESLIYYREAPFGFQATYSGGNSLLIQGDHDINGMITGGKDSKYYFYMSFKDLPVPVPASDMFLSGMMTGYFRNLEDWQILVKNGEWHLERGPVLTDTRFETTFRVSPDSLDLYEISYHDRYSSLKGYGQVKIANWTNRDFLGWIRIQDQERGEIYRGSLVSSSGLLAGEMIASRIPLERFAPLDMSGTASGRVRIGGQWDKPSFEGSIVTNEMKWRSEPGRISGDFLVSEELIQISSLDLLLGPLGLDKALVQLDRSQNKLVASGGLSYHHYDSRLEGRFSTGFDLAHSEWAQLFEQESFRGKLYLSDLYLNGAQAFPEQYFTIIKEPDSFSLKETKSNSVDFFYNNRTRAFLLDIGNPWPVTMSTRGRMTGGQIDAEVKDLVVHMPVFNYLMLKDVYLKDYFVVFKEGKAHGDLIITGDPRDPLIFGTLEIGNLLVDTPYTYSNIGKTECTLQFSEKEVRVEPFILPVESGSIEADAWFRLDHGLPSEYIIHTKARGRGRGQGVQVYYPLPYIDFDGIMTADIQITGNRSGAHFEGDVLFHKLEVTPGSLIDPLKSDRGDYPFRVTTDLRLKTGKDVVFYLPDKKNRIVEAVVNPNEELLLKADTLTQILILNGELTLKTGEINYFGKTFKLTEGSLTFNEDQMKFDPYLVLSAEIRTHDMEGDDVIITMLYDAPLSVLLSSFEPSFTSNPSKSQNEILTMLGQSFIPYDVQQEDWGAVPIRIAGDYLLEPNVIRPVEDILKQSLGLDMISIRTNIIENAILDRIYFNEYYLETDYNFSLGRYLDNTSFFLGQYLGSNLFLSGSLQFKYTEEEQENPLLNDLNLQTVFNFGLELKTPLLIINWNYSPGLSQDNFVADNQITLKWKFQF